MDCPFYLVIATKETKPMAISSRHVMPGGVSHIFMEIDSNEVDISFSDAIMEMLCAREKCSKEEIVSIIVIRNSTDGGPKMVECWE